MLVGRLLMSWIAAGSFGVLMTACESVLRSIEPPTPVELAAVRTYANDVLSSAAIRTQQSIVASWQKRNDKAATTRVRFQPYTSTNVVLNDAFLSARGSNTAPSIAKLDMSMSGRHCFEWSLDVDGTCSLSGLRLLVSAEM
jgi:hypothetical protein